MTILGVYNNHTVRMNHTLRVDDVMNPLLTEIVNNYDLDSGNDDVVGSNAFLQFLNTSTISLLYLLMSLCFVLNATSIVCIISSLAFSPINLLILNLAFSDILYASCIPMFVDQFTEKVVVQTETGCRLSFFLDVTCMIVNVCTVAALTLERYSFLRAKQLADPISDKSRRRYLMVFICLIWFAAISFALGKTLTIRQVYDEESRRFVCASTFNSSHERFYTILKWLLAFVLPYTIIIIFSFLLLKFLQDWSRKAALLRAPVNRGKLSYTTTLTRLFTGKSTMLPTTVNKSQSDPDGISLELNSLTTNNHSIISDYMSNNAVPPSTSRTPRTRVSKIKRRSTRFVLAVTVSFLMTWSPFWIMRILMLFSESESIVLVVFHSISLILTYLEGVLNPLLNILLTENFRDFVKKTKSGISACWKANINEEF